MIDLTLISAVLAFPWSYIRRTGLGRSSDTDLSFILPLVRTEGGRCTPAATASCYATRSDLPSADPLEVAVTFQYQPCVNAITVELPGGIISGQFTPKQTALQALRSDTSFAARNDSKVPTAQRVFNDCGMNSSTSRLSQVNIHLTQSARQGKNDPWRDHTGLKETRLVPLKSLTDFLFGRHSFLNEVCLSADLYISFRL